MRLVSSRDVTCPETLAELFAAKWPGCVRDLEVGLDWIDDREELVMEWVELVSFFEQLP